MLDKHYRPDVFEERIAAAWEAGGAFAPLGDGAPFTIALPPPNITGSLHIGHALDHTLQDVLIRWRRLQGRAALWQPGTDHAGIATQMVVERELARAGEPDRRTLGRDAFVQRVWAWKAQSGDTIVRQMRRLGQSADWSRQRFTMDEGLSLAVRRAFVSLHQDGLIYRDKRLVNWDCALQTAVSDLEVQPTEVDGHLWHIAYLIEGLPGRTITVATTRPETLLGDTGVAVHPDDPRYADLVGRHAILPLVGRRLRIVADAYSDPEKGTGAVKVTPAHDFNDFEVGRRHGLEAISILDRDGRLNAAVPEAYRGLDRAAARKQVVAELEALGALVQVERHRHTVPHGDRSGTPLEPLLTEQWYCDAATLAGPAIQAVERGQTRFVPASYAATYFDWLRNIQPWCISRQLWWGHQIPAWHGPDGKIFVAETEADAVAAAAASYGRTVALTQDPDVLDTWFSSGLWPFSTLGWPEPTADFARFYPTDVLVTGFDIIFFWVARMMMMGLHLTGQAPFHTVLIHGLVRDERGQKMSKTKGNVVDPLSQVDTYGADALRLALLSATAQGRDVKFGTARVESYRNFVTKLWNAARFIEMNEGRLDPSFDPAGCRLPLNRWIVGGTVELAAAVDAALEEYRFNDATLALHHFVRDDFCDWWIELAKPQLTGADPDARAEAQAVAGWVLAQLLHLLHPLAPFVTEALWAELFGAPGGMLVGSMWPDLQALPVDADAKAELGWLIRLIGGLRAARSELNVPPKALLPLFQQDASPLTVVRLERHAEAIARIARLSRIETLPSLPPPASLAVVVDEATFALPVGEVIDLAKERDRLRKDAGKALSEHEKLAQRLANADFVARAPEEVVAELRQRLTELEELMERLRAASRRIAA